MIWIFHSHNWNLKMLAWSPEYDVNEFISQNIYAVNEDTMPICYLYISEGLKKGLGMLNLWLHTIPWDNLQE